MRTGTTFVAAFLAALAWAAFQDLKTPKQVNSVRVSTGYGDGQLMFGKQERQPARIKGANIGQVERWTGNDGREYSLRVRMAGVGEHPEGYVAPTEEQFDSWLAYIKAGGSLPLDQWMDQ